MSPSVLFALASLLLAAVAILPGTLGILKFTHRFTAHPRGAFFTYVVSGPLYLLSAALLALSVYFASTGGGSRLVVLLAVLIFAVLSGFGFLMHTRFMFRPVQKPEYISVDEALRRFGEQEEVVGVLDRRGRPFAYIARMARRPHIVCHGEGDTPFLMSHCILSHSSMAYALTDQFPADRIYISSVLANNLVFYEKTTHCSVQQIYNCSSDNRRHLHCLPTVMTSLRSWKRFHPESKVWVRPRDWRDTFYLKLLARAAVIDPNKPDLVYPLAHEPDPRLPLKASVMGVEINGHAKAYPLESFRNRSMIEDVVGGDPVVFFAFATGDLVQLFSRKVAKNRILSFRSTPEGFQDVQTSSLWDYKGSCVAGEWKGLQLTPVPHYNKVFWCVWADFFPSTLVCGEKELAA